MTSWLFPKSGFIDISSRWRFVIPVNWLCINSSKSQAFFVSTCPIIGGKFAYTRKLLHFCVTDITLSTSHTGSTSRPRVNFMNHPKEIFERNCWDDESFHRHLIRRIFPSMCQSFHLKVVFWSSQSHSRWTSLLLAEEKRTEFVRKIPYQTIVWTKDVIPL